MVWDMRWSCVMLALRQAAGERVHMVQQASMYTYCSYTGVYVAQLNVLVQLGLAAATLVGVIAIVRVSQGQSLDSAASDFKRSANNAAGNAKAHLNQAQHKMS